MTEVVLVTYGLLTSFVLSSAERNRREKRQHSPVLRAMGYVLCGASAAIGISLFGYAGLYLAG